MNSHKCDKPQSNTETDSSATFHLKHLTKLQYFSIL